MAKLQEISAEELRARLESVGDETATKRLMMALAYLDGETPPDLSDRYGIPTSTIYFWLDRFENRSIEDAIDNEPRPDRPRKRSEEDKASLVQDLKKSPGEVGYSTTGWTSQLVQQHLQSCFENSCLNSHIRHFLRGITE